MNTQRFSTRETRTHLATELQVRNQDPKNRKNTSNSQDTGKTRSHMSKQKLAVLTSDPEDIMRNRANQSFLTTLRQAKLRSEVGQEPEVCLKATLESANNGNPTKPTS